MFAELSDRTWLWAAAACYFTGVLQGTFSLLRTGRPASGATYALILVGYLFQLAGLGIRGRAVGGCPLGNQFEVLQFTAWSAITLYLVVGVTFRTSLFGYFVALLATVLTSLSLAIPAWDATQRIHIFGHNPWIELHAALAVFSYGVFALLALTSVMFILRNWSLKSKHLGGWVSFLPSILDLEHIGVRLLGAGVTILSVALAVIVAYWLRDTSTANPTKILFTAAIWAAYVVVLILRLQGRLLGRRFASLCVALFFAALLSLGPVDASRFPAKAAATQEGRQP